MLRKLLALVGLFALFALIPAAQAPAAEPFTVAFAGDIVCSPNQSDYLGGNPKTCQFRLTDDLLASVDYVMPLGDLQYSTGSLTHFNQAYDPTWGQYASKTYPTPGNHEYQSSSTAAGYFNYWASKGRPPGAVGQLYYSFDFGNWHFISINTSDSVNGCGNDVNCAEGSAQNDWLEADLAAVPASKGIVMLSHSPFWNSGVSHGAESVANLTPMVADAEAARLDLLISSHEHNYQRYREQTLNGVYSATGWRQFVVGTGGRSHNGLLSAKDPGYKFGNATDFGVLKLTFTDTGYTYEFVNTAGTVVDSGGPIFINN